jgi:hypothetical protein
MYAWLAEDAEVEAFAVLRDELTHGLRIKLAGTRDALRLVVGCRRADVRVETARRSGDQVDRYRPRVAGVGGAQRLDSGLDGGGQRRVERSRDSTRTKRPRYRAAVRLPMAGPRSTSAR